MTTTASPRERPSGAADPEAALMLRVRDGDAAAFAELVRRHWPRVCGRLRRQLGDRQEAEDLTQEVFSRLYRARARYEPRAKFATWLHHITQNAARNALRSRRRRPWARLGALAGPAAEPPRGRALADPGGPPSRPLERAELAGRVRAAVAELGGRQRRAVELRQFQGRSHAEVAAALEVSPKAAKSLLNRARGRLRDSLATTWDG
jgi:RNA polymerase sigma-70 factor (ECF subfamily)